MASTTIDALLQATTPPRAGDAAARSGDGGGAFQPALEHALAEQPHPGAAASEPAATARPSSAEEPRPAVGDESQSHADAAPQDAGDRADDVDAADQSPEKAAGEDQDDTDAVEISTAAGAGATHPVATAQQQSTHQTAARKAAGHAIELKDAAEGSVRTARHAESGTAALTDAENADGDGKATAGTAKVDLASKSPGEIEPSHAVRSAEESRRRGEKSRGEPKKSPPGEKPAPKAPGEKTGVAQKAGPSGDGEDGAGAKRSTDAPTALKPTEPKAETADQKDNDDGGQRDAKMPAVAPRPVAATQPAVVSASGDPTMPARADKKESTEDVAIRPAAPNGAAAQAPSRGGASLERFSAPRGIRPAGITNDADAALQVDRARFVGRVEGAVRAAHQRDGRVQVRLSPPELGSLRIELTMQHGALTAHVEAETASARKLLLDNLPALRERLAQQDIRVEKFDVDVRRDGGGQAGGGGPQQRGDDQPARGPHDERPRPTASRAAPTIRSAPTAPAAISDAGLDVRV